MMYFNDVMNVLDPKYEVKARPLSETERARLVSAARSRLKMIDKSIYKIISAGEVEHLTRIISDPEFLLQMRVNDAVKDLAKS